MKKPILVVMAAGMGSRYGGLKQMDPVGNYGQVIMDYSLYDARRAGFETAVFIIKREIENDFRHLIGDRIARVMEVRYAFQELCDLPAGYTVPEGRTKPWGTSHAVLAARNCIDAPFAVINADDYYGPEAFQQIYQYLTEHPETNEGYEYAMVGYMLRNTLTENGYVSRGVCQTDELGYLTKVTERTHIEKEGEGARFTEDGGATWMSLPGDTVVSMNLWGFTPSFVEEAQRRFAAFLDRTKVENPLKGEYFLPSVVSELIEERLGRVKVLRSQDKWYGVTYKEDKPVVVDAIRRMTRAGVYPDRLWEM